MFADAHRPIVSRSRFAARMGALVIAAAFVDGIALAAGAIGYHSLEGLDWLDAGLNAALVMTGNGPIHPVLTPGGKIFTIFYSLLGVILFVAVIGVLLIPVLHRMLRRLHSPHPDDNEKSEQQNVAAAELNPVSSRGRT